MRNLKIKHKLFIFISLGAFVTSLLGWLFVQQSQTLYEQLIYRETVGKFYLFSQKIEEKFKEIDKLSLSVMSDSDVQNYLRVIKTIPDTYEAFDAANKLKQKLLTYHLYDYSVSSIVIIDRNTNPHSVGVNVDRMNYANMDEIRQLAYEHEGASVWMGGKLQEDAFFSVRDIREVADLKLESLGTLIIRIQADKVMYALPKESQDYDSSLVIVSGDDIIYPAQSSFHIKDLTIDKSKGYSVITIDNSSYLAAQFILTYTGWTIIHLIPYGLIFQNVIMMKAALLSLYAVILLLLLWSGLRFSRSITQPLETLTQKMVNVEKGQFLIDKAGFPSSRDEIGLLNRNFDKMTEKLDKLINENYTKQIMLKEAEYETLKAKVNPHFLYNTLESINWLAKINGQTEISGMVKALGDMMRVAVSQKEFVTLEEEIANLKNYIHIQQFRFEERLVCHMDIPEQLHPLYMPNIILQPIVENCIKYGIEAATERCVITVTAQKHLVLDRLILIVKDTGSGMDTQYLDKLQQNEISAEGTGIGLHSINQRIQLLFGDSYGLEIEAGLEPGTLIRVSIPCLAELPV
ncbi:sensor histidine kinase [Paenibacillus agricola]|uniref:histidine kinase n=1 Tax=Paenibacillus agricola TaxID=2716264 RepID=A0ABX0J7V9_9BACL|nr:sensor histidine kinase [Paenibacillus agricola]NHN32459.1 sensor histidine kinase [Paenibacillus agricola]